MQILTYHVIPGDIRASALTDGATVTTAQGTDVTFDLSGPTPKVNGAGIVAFAALHAYVPGLPRYGRRAIMPRSNPTEHAYD